MAEQDPDNLDQPVGENEQAQPAPDPSAETDDDLGFSQEDIDALLGEASEETAPSPSPSAKAGDEPAPVDAGGTGAVQTDEGAVDPADPVEASELDLPSFDDVDSSAEPDAEQSINLLKNVQLHVKVELGRTYMFVEDVLRLGEGSVVELDKLAGDPVDVYVNDRLVARGEVLVLNDNFCVRVSEIVAESDARMAG